MKLSFGVILLFILNYSGVFAQYKKSFDIHTGYGFYDALNLGIEYSWNKKSYISSSVGFDNYLFNKGCYYSVEIEYSLALLRNWKTVFDNYSWYLSSSIFIWRLEDHNYIWKAINFNPHISFRCDISRKLSLIFFCGPAINFVVYNHRKTFDEVGWPHYVQFNPGLQLNYSLK